MVGSKILWLCAAFVGFLLSTGASSDYQAGVQASARGDAKTAMIEWRAAAADGDARAQATLGIVLVGGEGWSPLFGYPVDVQEGRQWLERAAKQGHAGAQFELARFYYVGRGGEKDLILADKWLVAAAAGGNRDAQFRLADMYDDGRRVAEDPSEAFGWYREAAKQGHANAQHIVARMYASGRGVSQNNVLAYAWFTVALRSNPKLGPAWIAALSEEMTPPQIEEARTLAARLRSEIEQRTQGE